MNASEQFLSPSEAARRLGVSAKALRLYEARGLVRPPRSGVGWRAYGPNEMALAEQIVSFRKLGLSLGQIADVIGGGVQTQELALAAHQSALEAQGRQLTAVIEQVRDLRASLAQGRAPTPAEVIHLLTPGSGPSVAFDLPWPWGGERFELRDIGPINFITGPLGCGKTRLALRLAETILGAVFLPMERASDDGAAARMAMDADEPLQARVDQALAWVAEEGASPSDALITLLVGLEAGRSSVLVVDMVEQGLDEATQTAVMAYLRRPGANAAPLFLMTRSKAILDLTSVGALEKIILCPANHSPPTIVEPRSGAAGYEAVSTCLASPLVRARTEGMRAWRPVAA